MMDVIRQDALKVVRNVTQTVNILYIQTTLDYLPERAEIKRQQNQY